MMHTKFHLQVCSGKFLYDDKIIPIPVALAHGTVREGKTLFSFNISRRCTYPNSWLLYREDLKGKLKASTNLAYLCTGKLERCMHALGEISLPTKLESSGQRDLNTHCYYSRELCASRHETTTELSDACWYPEVTQQRIERSYS